MYGRSRSLVLIDCLSARVSSSYDIKLHQDLLRYSRNNHRSIGASSQANVSSFISL